MVGDHSVDCFCFPPSRFNIFCILLRLLILVAGDASVQCSGIPVQLIIDIDGLYQGGGGINNSYVRVIWITKTDLDQCLYHASVYASYHRLEPMIMFLNVSYSILRVIARMMTRESHIIGGQRVEGSELGRERESIPGMWDAATDAMNI